MIADPNKKSLIIVESPTKAKTIGKYLPSSCIVKASKGHVVDLNPNPNSRKGDVYGVDVDHGFSLDYTIVEGKEKILNELKKDLKKVDQLILASDEDREGESIAWHLLSQLQPKVPVYRMVFHEITKKAMTEAFNNCRDIDMNLVRAQEARRAVDKMAMNDYAVIFVTEQVAVTIEETIEHYNNQLLPAVILIPRFLLILLVFIIYRRNSY